MSESFNSYFVLLHPKLVHFPIALFISAIGLEIISLILKRDSLHRTALHLYVLSAFATPFVVLTGLEEAKRIHLNHPVLDKHRMFALWTMWVSLMSLPVLWLAQKGIPKYFRLIFLVFLFGVVTFVTFASHNGGRLVYEYGAGVEE